MAMPGATMISLNFMSAITSGIAKPHKNDRKNERGIGKSQIDSARSKYIVKEHHTTCKLTREKVYFLMS